MYWVDPRHDHPNRSSVGQQVVTNTMDNRRLRDRAQTVEKRPREGMVLLAAPLVDLAETQIQ